MSEIRLGDTVRMRSGAQFGHGDFRGTVDKIGRGPFHSAQIRVCTDFGYYRSVCTYWIPEAALEVVGSG